MSLNLAIDELEAVPRIGELFAKTGGQLGEQVTVFEGCGFSVQVQLGNLAGEQRVPLGIEFGHVTLGVPDLARNAQKLGGRALACNGSVDLAVIVEEALQGFHVTAVVSLIGAGHQQRKVLLLRRVACEVGMHALSDFAKESLEAGRRLELFSLAGIAECGIMSLLRALAGILSPAAGGVGFVEVDFALGDARFKIVEFSVKDADLAQVTSFKGLELSAKLGKLRFALSQPRANGGQLLALVEQIEIVRGLLEDDFGWHGAYRA
jgi:hypothetical protein